MKIEINNSHVPVSSLEYGDCFVHDGIVCMRCLVAGYVRNIRLSNGQEYTKEVNTVKPLKLKVVIDANP